MALLLLAGGCHAVSVDVDGWTFTADLGDKWRTESLILSGEDGEVLGWNSDAAYEGVFAPNAFWLPKETAVNPIAIQDGEFKDLFFDGAGIAACVDIKVNKIPTAVYGWSARDILADFYGSITEEDGIFVGKDSVKDIEFNGYPAYLVESDARVPPNGFKGANEDTELEKVSCGSLAVLGSNDTIVMLTVATRPESDLRAWDVIDSFTISPKQLT